MTKTKTAKEKKTKVSAAHKRESAMMGKLLNAHGYALLMPGRGQPRTQLMFDRKLKNTSVSYMMRLAVPADSALGDGIRRMYETEDATKKKPKVKR
jgi:hypothetical protein